MKSSQEPAGGFPLSAGVQFCTRASVFNKLSVLFCNGNRARRGRIPGSFCCAYKRDVGASPYPTLVQRWSLVGSSSAGNKPFRRYVRPAPMTFFALDAASLPWF